MATRVSLVPSPVLTASITVPKPAVRVRVNNDQAIIAWKYNGPIVDCIGFTLHRRLKNGTETVKEEVLLNRIGFAGEPFTRGEQRPSTEWPIQRFVWTDFNVKQGDVVSYKITPVLYNGEILIPDHKNASSWSKEIAVTTGINSSGAPSPFRAFFNRGIVSSQFFSRMTQQATGTNLTVKEVITGPNIPLRNFLGGFLDNRLFDLLNEVNSNDGLTLYGALYELNQSDLLNLLSAIGNRANIILANGAADKTEDRNAESRDALKRAGVRVHDRIVDATKKHFAHNKFLVVCEGDAPKRVWTGSANWTASGLFAQVNNAVLIDDSTLAQTYLTEWKALLNDVESDNNGYGDALYATNRKSFGFHNKASRAWFSPTRQFNDLRDVETVLEGARESVLFLMFNPGSRNTFFNYILDLQQRKPELFIHGIINQDPGASSNSDLILFHKGQHIQTDWDSILPKKIDKEFAFWYKEVSAGLVTIHSKVLVIDAFGDRPFVVTGSHNFGPKASSTNDENMLVINDRRLAEEYAVNTLAVYDHYRWRYSLFHSNTDFKGLTRDRDWMTDYMTNEVRMKELRFWF